MKISQRPPKHELIERNILQTMTDDDRRIDRSVIGAKLIRRLSLRPSMEELEERNIMKSKNAKRNFLTYFCWRDMTRPVEGQNYK